jgi:hypothetical protein
MEVTPEVFTNHADAMEKPSECGKLFSIDNRASGTRLIWSHYLFPWPPFAPALVTQCNCLDTLLLDSHQILSVIKVVIIICCNLGRCRWLT